jgi:hypothetical protein
VLNIAERLEKKKSFPCAATLSTRSTPAAQPHPMLFRRHTRPNTNRKQTQLLGRSNVAVIVFVLAECCAVQLIYQCASLGLFPLRPFFARKRRWIRFYVRDCADFYLADEAVQSRTRKRTQKRTQKRPWRRPIMHANKNWHDTIYVCVIICIFYASSQPTVY